jgi:hypothetical protein
MDFDDLVQEGVACYYKVISRYRPRDKRHIMSLFQRTFINHIHLLARYKSRQIDDPTDRLPHNVTCADAELAIFIADAPPLVKSAIKTMMTVDLNKPYRRRRDGTRETMHDRLCRLMGLDPNGTPNIPGEIRAYLSR